MPLDERLLKDLQLERDLSRNPLFQIVFVFQNAPTRQALQLSGLTVTSMEVPSKTAQVDLSLYMWESEEGLKGFFEYNHVQEKFEPGRRSEQITGRKGHSSGTG